MDSHDSRVAFHHHVSCVSSRFSDESHTAVFPRGKWRITADERPNGLCACSGLAESSTCEDEPVVPVSFWQPLIRSCVEFPEVFEVFDFVVGELINDLRLLFLRHRFQRLKPGTLFWPG